MWKLSDFLVFKIVNVLTIDFVASSNRLDVELQILYSQKNKSDDVNNLEYGIYDTFENYTDFTIDRYLGPFRAA